MLQSRYTFFVFGLILLTPLIKTNAQALLHIKSGCAYKTAAEEEDLYTFESSEDARRIVLEICNTVGLSQNFDIRSSNVENAMAVNDESRRVILYSTIFLKKFNEDAHTRWAAYSVLAHEIGHHLNNHNFAESNPGKRKQMELEADRFSGSALRLLGATLDEAKAGIETFSLEGEQQYHPSAKARKEALANGWNQQQERLEKMGAGVGSTSQDNIPRQKDSDSDGIPDGSDACPDEYGRALTAGCPDADEDGIPDKDDKCKYLKGPSNWKGCPDSDNDGIPDSEDRCPKDPGLIADGGCPPPDRDEDTVIDRVDKCPDQRGLTRFQGCPDTDNDGIPDPEDKCPGQAGEQAYDGCPKTSIKSSSPPSERKPTTDKNPTSTGTATKGNGGYYYVNTSTSKIKWKGYKVTGSHTGFINLKSGKLKFNNDVLVGGEFEVDMNSITDTDLEGEWASKLVGHLKSADFFDAAIYPIAKFTVTSAIPQDTKGNYKILGNMTIKGITKEVRFFCNLADSGGGKKIAGNMTIDRSLFNVKYGSGSFFEGLGDKTIYDEFDLQVELSANQ